jgi:hypothetical protein
VQLGFRKLRIHGERENLTGCTLRFGEFADRPHPGFEIRLKVYWQRIVDEALDPFAGQGGLQAVPRFCPYDVEVMDVGGAGPDLGKVDPGRCECSSVFILQSLPFPVVPLEIF